MTWLLEVFYKWKYGSVEVITKSLHDGRCFEEEYISNKKGVVGCYVCHSDAYWYFSPSLPINEWNSKYLNYEDWLYE